MDIKYWFRKACLLSAVSLTLMVSVGCAYHSSFQRSYDVTRQFENGRVLPDHTYYVGGPEKKPNAIVAIRDDYNLVSEHWRKVAPTTETLKQLVDTIGFVDGAEYKERQFMHNGARIHAPDGTIIGDWYSVYEYSRIRFTGEKDFYLSFPPTTLPPNVRQPGFERDVPWP